MSRTVRFVIATVVPVCVFAAVWWIGDAAGLVLDATLGLAGLGFAVAAAPLLWWATKDDQRRQLPRATSTARSIIVGDVPRRPPAFQPRPELLNRLHDQATRQRRAVVCSITGGRGVGKTQLAAEYARDRIEHGWSVAWINAETHDQLLAGLDQLGEALGLSSPDGDSEATLRHVRRWIGECDQDFLLVFDNAEDPAALNPWLPATGNAYVVVTSTHRDFEDMGTPIGVGLYEPAEALAFLRERTGKPDSADARRLAEELGHLPLALAQAAAVIHREHLGYAEYVERLRALPLAAALGHDRASPYPSGVAESTLLSLRAVEETDGHGWARRLIGWLAVLAANGVPKDLLIPRDADELRRAQTNEALAALAECSLLDFSQDDTAVTVHRLVQRVVADRARQDGTFRDSLAGATRLVADRLGVLAGDWAQRHRVDELITQAEALWENASADLAEDRELAARVLALRSKAVWHLTRVEDPTRAVALGRAVLRDCEQALGEPHPDTLSARHHLARGCRLAGRLDESILLYEAVATERERVLGADDPDTLASRHQLADAYRRRGRLREAVALHEQVLADRQRVLGSEHVDVLQSRNDLAYTYRSAGRLTDAIALHQRVLAEREAKLGTDHLDTLVSKVGLAGTLRAAGRIEEPLVLFDQAEEARRRLLGPDHPDTLAARNARANTLRRAERLVDAIQLYESVLADRERVLGNEHRDTLLTCNELATAHRRVGGLEAALALHQRALTGQEQVLGPGHVDTLRTRNSLANTFLAASGVEAAIGLHELVLADQRAALDPDHPDTLVSQGDLGVACLVAGRVDEAAELLQEAVGKQRRLLSADHPDTLVSQRNLAHALRAAGRFDAAVALYEETLEACERALDPGHPVTRSVRRSLGETR